MGSGGLAVDAMAIACLGVDRRGERFFVLSHFLLDVSLDDESILEKNIYYNCPNCREKK
jgi:hypothetical protein